MPRTRSRSRGSAEAATVKAEKRRYLAPAGKIGVSPVVAECAGTGGFFGESLGEAGAEVLAAGVGRVAEFVLHGKTALEGVRTRGPARLQPR